MLPRNPLLKFAPRRAASALVRVRNQIWHPVESACIFDPSTSGQLHPLTLPHYWGRLYQSRKFTLSLPSHTEGKPLWLRWVDQAEATLFIDGNPYFGFDVAHRECLLPVTFGKLEIDACCVQSAIWHPAATGLDPQGSKLEGASYLARSDACWKLYHDFLVLLELVAQALKQDLPEAASLQNPKWTLPDLVSVRPFTRRLLRLIDTAVDLLDTQGVEPMQEHLDLIYASFPSESWNLDATLTGHAHIDLVWLWPESVGEIKAVHTFTNVDYLMSNYPEFTFGYSQPASYEAVARRRPDLAKRIAQRRREGRWEAVGALYVESDTLLPCGEALARSFEVGQAGFVALNGEPNDTLWLPDAFGYSGSLPQLMQHYGVTRFFTNKLTWNDTTLFPHTSFRWIGNDGSEVLAHVQPETEQSYNGCLTLPELDRAQNRHQQSDIHPEALIPTGYGDGGGGPTAEMCERARRVKNLTQHPRCRWGSIRGFYDRLAAIQADLPAYHGEILLQFHRGTYSSRSCFKSLYRKIECALQRAELVAACRQNGSLDTGWWKRLVFSQFHDILPGSSVYPAYVELEREFAKLLETIAEFTTNLLEGSDQTQTFNPTPYTQRTWVGDRVLEIPAYSSGKNNDAEALTLDPVEADVQHLKTPDWEATFNALGEISALRFGPQSIPTAGPLNQLILYPNHPHKFDAWEIDRQTLSLPQMQNQPAVSTITRHHAGKIDLTFTRRIGRQSSVDITYHADVLVPTLRITYAVDWQEPQAMLKALFPTQFRSDHVRFAQAFGSTMRRQNPQTLADEAHWEVPASRWMLLSDESQTEGLSIITENKYGFSHRHGTVGVTLLTSPLITGEGSEFARAFPLDLRDTLPDSPFTDVGPHEFSLILAPWHAGATSAAQYPAPLADYAFSPPMPHTQANLSLPVRGVSGCDSVSICWIQPVSEQKFIIKTIESMGRRGTARLLLNADYSATPINGLHQSIGPSLVDQTFAVTPYRLQCFLITPSQID